MKIQIKRITSVFTWAIILGIFIYYGYNKIKGLCLNLEYPNLQRNTMLTGIVDTSFSNISGRYRGTLCIKLVNGSKFCGAVSVYPKEENGKRNLLEFLSKGDSIYKPMGKDSLYVFKNRIRYSFFLPTQESHDEW